LRWAKFANTPRASETRVKITSAIRVGGWAWSAAALPMRPPLADVALQLRRVVLAEVVVGHVEPGEAEREHGTDGPRDHDPPERPRRDAEDRPDVLHTERVPRAAVAEQIAVDAAVRRAREPDRRDDQGLAAGVLQDGVGPLRHRGRLRNTGR